MKITALLVLKSPGGSSASASASASGGREEQQQQQQPQAVVLANASDVSHLGYFQRPAAREFVLFVARTVALRTPAGRRQSVQHQGTQVLPACLFLLLAPPTPTQSVAN
jgi:synaptobrevin family protein YKT6